MKVVCDGLDLSIATAQVIKAISNKTTNPVLEGIKLTAENDTFCSIFGGDEGTCTPVPPKDQKVFYVCSLSFNVLAFKSANRPKNK